MDIPFILTYVANNATIPLPVGSVQIEWLADPFHWYAVYRDNIMIARVKGNGYVDLCALTNTPNYRVVRDAVA